MSETVRQIVSGTLDDGVHWFVPGVNCIDCGRFVGRDGDIEIETFEMSDTVASVSGQCRKCISAHSPAVAGSRDGGDGRE